MADEINNTSVAAVIPEVWRGLILDARYSAAIGDKVAYTDFPEIKAKGDIVHVPVFPRLSTNAVGAAGTLTNQNITITDVSITVNNWFETTVQIVDLAGIQSLFGDTNKLAQQFAKQFGPRLAEKMDNDLFGLHGSITTNTVGSTASPSAMSSALLRQALQKLDEGRVPKQDRNLVMSPQAFWELFSEDKLALAYATGLAKGVAVSGPDSVPTLFGIKYYQSTEIASTGTPAVWKNLLLHKEALAQVMQRNLTVLHLAKTDLSERYTGHVLYEPAALRETHGCVINTADT